MFHRLNMLPTLLTRFEEVPTKQFPQGRGYPLPFQYVSGSTETYRKSPDASPGAASLGHADTSIIFVIAALPGYVLAALLFSSLQNYGIISLHNYENNNRKTSVLKDKKHERGPFACLSFR